ncbi:MAG TPA: hypothetical protein VLK53_12305 [Gaiellaceae bacterium]|nr:hypothetical protein [Gaiellaceae bacterium]
MRITYGVVWQEGEAPLARGKLELLPNALLLDGVTGSGHAVREIQYEELSTVRVGRAGSERLDGRPTLLLDLVSGARVTVASVAQAGIAAELVERLAGVTLGATG